VDKRAHIYYSGSVQGVGFRYSAERLAFDLDLSGWVMNLRDGRVEIIAEGKEKALLEFLQKLDRAFGIYIRNVDTQWSDATGEFAGFDIRFDQI
jgi:acylphosphatase